MRRIVEKFHRTRLQFNIGKKWFSRVAVAVKDRIILPANIHPQPVVRQEFHGNISEVYFVTLHSSGSYQMFFIQ